AAVIASYFAEAPERSFLVRDDQGEVAGFLVARHNALGPWAARDDAGAEVLLAAALALDFPEGLLVNVPAENTAAPALLRRYGFEQTRSLPHMRRGPPVPRRRELQFALASFATG
ncbi:MAG TPA: hypothetical protein VFA70_05200, partial [Dehalococcoidia bacterium]|nr:hypothetical protein [Dehalococcoidia bacterium]